MAGVLINVRPRYSEATPEQLKLICNGVGPEWASPALRELITKMSLWFFDEASWNHHDFGYYIGCTEQHRAEYDRKFLSAMLRDAKRISWYKRPAAWLLSLVFYSTVRLWGWTSFYYADTYRTL